MPHPNKSQQVTSLPSSKNVDIEKCIEHLFLRFGAIYGHIWFSMYKNENLLKITKEEWVDALQRFDVSILQDALLKCRDNNPYPPTLPQFIECCNALNNRLKFHAVRDNREVSRPTDIAVVEAHIANIRKILKR